MNESGAFFWDCLLQETTADEVVKKVLDVYEVTPEKAAADVDKFITMLRENDLLEE